jgi:hypothetical protein
MPTRILIPENDIDPLLRAFRFDLLSLPHSTISDLYVNGRKVDASGYTVSANTVKFLGERKLQASDDIQVYLEVKSRRINIERYTAIIVALIGLLGTVLSVVLQPDWFREAQGRTRLVTFEADQYGVDRANKEFRAIVRWEAPSEKNSTFEERITGTSDAWAFLRIRDNLVDIRAATVDGVLGPVPMRNGMLIEVPILDTLYARYTKENKWLQLIAIAAPKGRKVVDGLKISDLGDDVKVVVSPAVKPSP